jgi:hypothetical protein
VFYYRGWIDVAWVGSARVGWKNRSLGEHEKLDLTMAADVPQGADALADTVAYVDYHEVLACCSSDAHD